MNERLKLSPTGQRLIQAFESCLKPVGNGRFAAYLDPVHVPTIGWGHTNHNGRQFRMGDVWTKAECDDEFRRDMAVFEKAVKELVTVPLKQYQFDALVSFSFNVGGGNLGKSTLLKKVNREDFEGAALEFAKWNKAGGRVFNGLVRRRASEAVIFRGLRDDNYDGVPDDPEETMPQAVDEPKVAPITASPIANAGAGTAAVGAAGVITTFLGYLKEVPGEITKALLEAMKQPTFWVALVVIATGSYIWWKRKKLKENQGV